MPGGSSAPEVALAGHRLCHLGPGRPRLVGTPSSASRDPCRHVLLASLLGIRLVFHKNRMWWRACNVVPALMPLFPGTECIALARTALSPAAASPRVQGRLSAPKWLLGCVCAPPGSWFPARAGTLALGTPPVGVQEHSMGKGLHGALWESARLGRPWATGCASAELQRLEVHSASLGWGPIDLGWGELGGAQRRFRKGSSSHRALGMHGKVGTCEGVWALSCGGPEYREELGTELQCPGPPSLLRVLRGCCPRLRPALSLTDQRLWLMTCRDLPSSVGRQPWDPPLHRGLLSKCRPWSRG